MSLVFFGLLPIAKPQGTRPVIQDALQYEGQRIAAIEYEPADQPLTHKELAEKLPFNAGSIFHERDLQQAIQNLYATGRYAELAIDGRETPQGLALRFLTKRAYFTGRLTVTGVKAPPNQGEIASALKLRLGQPYVDSQKTEATEALRSLLRANGFYQANIVPRVSFDQANQQANLTFHVETGDRARFEQPEITGDPEQNPQRIIRATRWKRLYGLLGWQEVTDNRTRQGLENVRRYYAKKDLLDSRVTLTRLPYDSSTNRVKPTIDIEAGLLVDIRVAGAHISRGTLKRLVPIFQEHSLDTDLLREGQNNVQQYLVTQGYFRARVSYEISGVTGQGARVVTYHVSRGRRHKLVYIQLQGEHYFSAETIRERLFIAAAEFPRFPYGRFSNVYLKQDLQAIENLYAANGFRNARITSRIEDRFRGKHDHLAVFITIEEGPQWFVSRLSIEGAASDDLAALRSRITSSDGQPFSETNVAVDRENILTYFYDHGYINASFAYDASPTNGAQEVELRYVITPGQRKYVRDVLISGLETTRPRLVQQRMELDRGEPLSLSQETDTQRRLYELGIFARVNTALQNPDGDEQEKTVLYDIDEARHYSLNVGVGAQIARLGGGVTTLDNPAGSTGFAPRLAVGVSRINFLGLGQTVGVQGSVSTIEQRAALSYFVPEFVSNDKLSLTFSTLIDNASDIRTFTAHRREASVQLGQRVSRAYTLQYRLVFRNVTLSNLKIDRLLVPLLSQPETVGLGELSFIQDKRDDPTDAHRGIYTTADISYAPGVLGSQTHFARGLFRNATYHPIGREVVFARSTQFGVISRTGGRPSVPLAERLYSGGSTSIRAFPDFQAGPRDLATGFPLGGNALFTNNLELRFPLYGDNLAGVLFHDAGNVYDTLSDVSFRFRQRDLQDFNYLVQSVGFGLRYRTPIGPVRLDLSFSPDAPRFFGLKGTEQDYLNGTAIPAVQKINAFQFHFSLGQAF